MLIDVQATDWLLGLFRLGSRAADLRQGEGGTVPLQDRLEGFR